MNPDVLFAAIGEERLAEYVTRQRWFGAKSRELLHFGVLAAPVAREQDPPLVLAVVEARFGAGTHELYQVPLGLRPAGEWTEGVVGEVDGVVAYDAMTDPELAAEIVRLMERNARVAVNGRRA